MEEKEKQKSKTILLLLEVKEMNKSGEKRIFASSEHGRLFYFCGNSNKGHFHVGNGFLREQDIDIKNSFSLLFNSGSSQELLKENIFKDSSFFLKKIKEVLFRDVYVVKGLTDLNDIPKVLKQFLKVIKRRNERIKKIESSFISRDGD